MIAIILKNINERILVTGHMRSFAGYSIQLERMVTTLSGSVVSLVTRWRLKLCMPPISPCMKNSKEMVVLSPGLRAIEPMAGLGGQHPSKTSIYGASLKRKGWSPTLVTFTTVRIGTPPSLTSP